MYLSNPALTSWVLEEGWKCVNLPVLLSVSLRSESRTDLTLHSKGERRCRRSRQKAKSNQQMPSNWHHTQNGGRERGRGKGKQIWSLFIDGLTLFWSNLFRMNISKDLWMLSWFGPGANEGKWLRRIPKCTTLKYPNDWVQSGKFLRNWRNDRS